MVKKVIIFILILLLIGIATYFGKMFHKNYRIVILKRGLECECEIKGTAMGSVLIGERLYSINDSVCGGKIISISPDKITVMFKNTKNDFKIGEVIERLRGVKLSLGISKEEVIDTIGNPYLVKESAYNKGGVKIDVWEYVETFRAGWEKRYRLYFTNDKLTKVSGREY